MTAGCKTVENRTVINNKDVEEERRRAEGGKLKELGNQAYRSGHATNAVCQAR